MNGWGLLWTRSQSMEPRNGAFEVPSLESDHNLPTVPQFLQEFVFLVLPSGEVISQKAWRGLTFFLPDNGHRGVRLSRNSPSVRIDMHGEFIQVLKDPE